MHTKHHDHSTRIRLPTYHTRARLFCREQNAHSATSNEQRALAKRAKTTTFDDSDCTIIREGPNDEIF